MGSNWMKSMDTKSHLMPSIHVPEVAGDVICPRLLTEDTANQTRARGREEGAGDREEERRRREQGGRGRRQAGSRDNDVNRCALSPNASEHTN